MEKEFYYYIGGERFTSSELMEYFFQKAIKEEDKKGFWKSNYPTRWSFSSGFHDGVNYGVNLMASIHNGDKKYGFKSEKINKTATKPTRK